MQPNPSQNLQNRNRRNKFPITFKSSNFINQQKQINVSIEINNQKIFQNKISMNLQTYDSIRDNQTLIYDSQSDSQSISAEQWHIESSIEASAQNYSGEHPTQYQQQSQNSEQNIQPSSFSSLFQQSQQDNQSAYFPENQRQNIYNLIQIQNLPLMQWGILHNRFNKGEKCTVCLDQFKIKDKLRVIQCLHRFHKQCVDEWFSKKANCPICRINIFEL